MTIRHRGRRSTPNEPDAPDPDAPTPVDPPTTNGVREWWRHHVAYLWDPSFIPDEDRWTPQGMLFIALLIAATIIGGIIHG